MDHSDSAFRQRQQHLTDTSLWEFVMFDGEKQKRSSTYNYGNGRSKESQPRTFLRGNFQKGDLKVPLRFRMLYSKLSSLVEVTFIKATCAVTIDTSGSNPWSSADTKLISTQETAWSVVGHMLCRFIYYIIITRNRTTGVRCIEVMVLPVSSSQTPPGLKRHYDIGSDIWLCVKMVPQNVSMRKTTF